MIDREKHNADRAKSAPVLAGVRLIYEGQFGKVSMVSSAAGPTTFLQITVPPLRSEPTTMPTGSPIILDAYEAMGFGRTLLGALVDWQLDLANAPQGGSHLVWRVLPECDWSFDFDTEKLLWKVYARFAILPKDTP